MKESLFMETTKIDPLRTASEVTSLLVQSGARQISQQYDGKQKLVGVSFTLEVLPGLVRFYRLPVKADPVFKIINGRRKSSWDRTNNATKDREQAERVAWRQTFRWCQAQLAMIHVGMVEAAEVFLPYMENENGETLYQRFLCDSQKALPAGDIQ
jgi:hypothetical protein